MRKILLSATLGTILFVISHAASALNVAIVNIGTTVQTYHKFGDRVYQAQYPVSISEASAFFSDPIVEMVLHTRPLPKNYIKNPYFLMMGPYLPKSGGDPITSRMEAYILCTSASPREYGKWVAVGPDKYRCSLHT